MKIKKKLSNFLNRNLIFFDIGARSGLEDPWKTYRNFINVVSFEPDYQEYLELKKQKIDRDMVFPFALLNKEKKISLNLTQSRGCTSTYEPNTSFLKRFPDVERFTIEEKKIVDATTLDILFNKNLLSGIDFIKIDTQGSELDIIKGGKQLLKENILGVQVEVEFKEMYKSQPLFSEIDFYIREQLGLELFDINKTYWKYSEGRIIGPSKGQIIFGDALYFRDPYDFAKWCDSFSHKDGNNKIILACFMSLIYGYPDYSLCLINQPKILNRFDDSQVKILKSIIFEFSKKVKISFKGSRKIWSILNLLSKIFEPNFREWGYSDRRLGSRKKFGIYY